MQQPERGSSDLQPNLSVSFFFFCFLRLISGQCGGVHQHPIHQRSGPPFLSMQHPQPKMNTADAETPHSCVPPEFDRNAKKIRSCCISREGSGDRKTRWAAPPPCPPPNKHTVRTSSISLYTLFSSPLTTRQACTPSCESPDPASPAPPPRPPPFLPLPHPSPHVPSPLVATLCCTRWRAQG